MGNLFIAQSKRTPEVIFLKNGEFQIIGSSIPEDAVAFYNPLMLWLKGFFQEKPTPVTISVYFEYINTSSTTHIIKLLKYIIAKIEKKSALKIIWKFDEDDEDAFELGEMIQKIIKHPILYIKSIPDKTS